ncbi:hypothetical protein [Candidatus Chlorohelix sp.]|uniref:hypothetical protein n=1 Tax=Candidatus Chlorohelix sp. TaxID=3139201 RepID=UPI0030373F81
MENKKKSTIQIKIIAEEHPDGWVAYPLGIEGVVIGDGNTKEEAINDLLSAIKFHMETFGEQTLGIFEDPIISASVEEVTVPV